MSSAWRCLECGALYEQHFAICCSCFRAGGIVPVPRRLGAATDSVPGVSNARAIARMSWARVEQAAYPALQLGARALVEVSGPPGAGKSSFACRLADAVRGPTLLVAAEEGISPSLAARLLRCAVKRDDFHVLTRASVDQVVAFCVERKIVCCAVDSVQECSWSASELRHLLEVVPSLDLLVGVLQVTKDLAPAGAMALQHECDVHVSVEGMRWKLKKSRYQDLTSASGDVLPQRREESTHAAA